MKIIYTLQEATNRLRDYENEVQKTQGLTLSEVEITTPNYPMPDYPIASAILVVTSIPHYSTCRKIDAIKALREHAARFGVRIGLLEAKQFVESLPHKG